ncbi:MAG: prenyl cysteine carboxyl methyltransferase Ste14 [Lasallia pustulata]|uniref:Protein-S-isoprenylcysteine O-methyltransferase n=1 Tax=Lasallia pustulata TaxID=136370 RepID=A0A5M8PRL8_9LECA|nr:MAG: prenyl cysteine carboxyl methyltransferase Ste14 [Lasallia pustulata]
MASTSSFDPSPSSPPNVTPPPPLPDLTPSATSPPTAWPLNRPSNRPSWTPTPHPPQPPPPPFLHQQRATPLPHPPPFSPSLLPSGAHSLSGISLRSFLLGLTLGTTLTLTLHFLLLSASPLWRAPFFLSALSLFHFLEYHTTATHNPRAATLSAFLLSNGSAYTTAHTLAFLECVLPSPFPALGPPWGRRWALGVGLAMMVMRRKEGHELVTGGVYAWLRHPSYFGFWWWGLGTQVVLGNVVCLVGYAAVLWRFFSGRIQREEELLVEFFGDRYVEYRKRTWVGIPFIP